LLASALTIVPFLIRVRMDSSCDGSDSIQVGAGAH
jgi:hypothetical protein